MAITSDMARMTVRSTFALDPETVEALDRTGAASYAHPVSPSLTDDGQALDGVMVVDPFRHTPQSILSR